MALILRHPFFNYGLKGHNNMELKNLENRLKEKGFAKPERISALNV
jgi:hypothetical protein